MDKNNDVMNIGRWEMCVEKYFPEAAGFKCIGGEERGSFIKC